MRELKLTARVENLTELQSCLEEYLEEMGVPMDAQFKLSVAAEEVFVNIASYAYHDSEGPCTVTMWMREPENDEEKRSVNLRFADSGQPFDPLKKEAPPKNPLDSDRVGGLGIYMVRKSMDRVDYEYRNGENVLTISLQVGDKPKSGEDLFDLWDDE